MVSDFTSFDATSSFVGYLYQVRYALLLALKKIDDVDDPDNCFISIEKLDDVAFEESGTPSELLQMKHHTKAGNITDRSQDIWKTVRVWSEFVASSNELESAVFSLVTTEVAAESTIAEFLSCDKDKRNPGLALERMRSISQETKSETNKKAYEAFCSLEPWQQNKLVSSIYIIGSSPSIVDIRHLLLKKLRSAVFADYVDPFLTRLEGKWFSRIIDIFCSSDEDVICLSEVLDVMDDLRNQFLPSNLPADFSDAILTNIDLDGDARRFLEQLRLIGASNRVLTTAVINFYRAYEQRSRWSKDNLLRPGEIKKYLDRLKDEWENYYGLLEMEYDFSQEQQMVNFGAKLYSKCQLEAVIPIRAEFSEPYVARGSYNTLADDLAIGWHPDYQSYCGSGKSEGVA